MLFTGAGYPDQRLFVGPEWEVREGLPDQPCRPVSGIESSLGCSRSDTYMEFGLVWYLTGWGLTPLVSIQNPDSEKFQEVSERGLASFSVLKKTECQAWGGNGAGKKTESKNSWTLFFHTISPPCLRTLKLASPLSLTSWHFSETGFWILTKGVKPQPVRGQTSPNSI